MPFPRMQARQYPSRRWELSSYPAGGKTTFAARMKPPLLVVDADGRFDEVLFLQPNAFALSENPDDNRNAARIAELLRTNMPGSDVATIVVDSLTPIVSPQIAEAILKKDLGMIENLAAAMKGKAMTMRVLQDAVTNCNRDTLWLYHLFDARKAKAKQVVRQSLPRTERARLVRSLNMRLQIVTDAKGRRGILVVWARRGRSGMTLWDDSHTWVGMPERIEQAAYDGLTPEEMAAIENTTTQTFPDDTVAIAWGYASGAFKALQHSRNAWDELQREERPADMAEASALWIEDVMQRLADLREREAKVHASQGTVTQAERLPGLEGTPGASAPPGESPADVIVTLRQQLVSLAEKTRRPITDAQAGKMRGLLAGTLLDLLGSEAKRRELIAALWPESPQGSLNDLTPQQVAATLEWLALKRNPESGRYEQTDGTQAAKLTAEAVLVQALKAHGQQSLL